METLRSQIWPEDHRIRALQWLYFLQTCFAVLARVLAYSWLLHVRTSEGLPLVYLLQAFPLSVLAFAMSGWVDRVGRAALNITFNMGVAVVVGMFIPLLWLEIPWTAGVFLLVVETSIALLSMQFWLLTSELVSPEEARFHFPALSVYGALGAIFSGALMTSPLAESLEQQLLLLLPTLLGGALLSSWIDRRFAYRLSLPTMHETPASWWGQLRGMGDLLQRASVLRYVVVLNALISCAGLIIDFLYCVSAERFSQSHSLTLFFSSVQVITNLAQLGFVILLGRHLFTLMGLVRTLSSYPVGGVTLSALGMLMGPVVPAVMLKVFDRLENYLVLNPGVGIILSTLPREERGRVSLFYSGLLKPLVFVLTGLALLSFTGSITQLLVALGVLMVLFFPLLGGLARSHRRALVENLASSDAALVQNSIEALAERENQSAVPELLALYQSSSDPVVRENILAAAGRMADPRFIPILLPALKESNTSLGWAAARSLAHFDTPEVKEALREALRETDSARVKASILSALTQVGQKGHLSPLLLSMLHDTDERVQANAVEAIGLLHDEKLLKCLEPFLIPVSPRSWANAVVALGQHPRYREKALSSLREQLLSPHLSFRISALYAAGELRAEVFLPSLRVATLDSDAAIRRHAWIALAKMGRPESVPALAGLIASRDEAARATARALPQLPQELRMAIVERLTLAGPEARAAALHAMETCQLNLQDEVLRLKAASNPLLNGSLQPSFELIESKLARKQEAS
ncbi:MAG: HEAT repeat domain-containing protein [Myxococcota bacterium]